MGIENAIYDLFGPDTKNSLQQFQFKKEASPFDISGFLPNVNGIIALDIILILQNQAKTSTSFDLQTIDAILLSISDL